MEQPLTYLRQRAGEDWLIGYDSHEFHCLTEQLFQELTQFSQGGTTPKIGVSKKRCRGARRGDTETRRRGELLKSHVKFRSPPKILLAEENPLRFLAAFLAAVAANCSVFLCNPHWVEWEWQQVLDLVQPDLIFGANKVESRSQELGVRSQESGLIFIPTGGSSGKIRFAAHSWQTLMASVAGFHQYFEQKPINSFCVLPLYHVSGLMQFLRSLTTGGRIVIMPFKALTNQGRRQEAGGRRQESKLKFLPNKKAFVFEGSSLRVSEECNINTREFFLSLVPTQLARLMNLDASSWLSCFRTVLLGGAPPWNSLLEQARLYNIPLAPTYGMTETASGVVTLKPEAFLRGNNSNGAVLPHAVVTIRTATGEILDANQTGMITIQADSLALGYYAEREALNPQSLMSNFPTDDLGFFDEQGYLHIIGRHSNKIITGGENVFPAEVEAAIQATQLVTDVCVIGVPDSDWGQVVTAIYVPCSLTVSPRILEAAIEDKLSKYKRPKHWISATTLQRNAQGKVNYEQLQEMVNGCLTI